MLPTILTQPHPKCPLHPLQVTRVGMHVFTLQQLVCSVLFTTSFSQATRQQWLLCFICRLPSYTGQK